METEIRNEDELGDALATSVHQQWSEIERVMALADPDFDPDDLQGFRWATVPSGHVVAFFAVGESAQYCLEPESGHVVEQRLEGGSATVRVFDAAGHMVDRGLAPPPFPSAN